MPGCGLPHSASSAMRAIAWPMRFVRLYEHRLAEPQNLDGICHPQERLSAALSVAVVVSCSRCRPTAICLDCARAAQSRERWNRQRLRYLQPASPEPKRGPALPGDDAGYDYSRATWVREPTREKDE